MFDGLIESLQEFAMAPFKGLCMLIYSLIFGLLEVQVSAPREYLGQTPDEFATHFEILDALQAVSDNVIMPLAVCILTCILCHELIKAVTGENNSNFNDIDISTIIIKWIIKAWVSLIALTNYQMIVNGIFGLGSWVSETAITSFGLDASITWGDITNLTDSIEAMTFDQFGDLILLLIFGIFILISTLISIVVIYVVVINRLIEMLVYSAVAPIPFATFANSEWSSIGKNYLKNIFALLLQAFIIILAIGVYKTMIIGQIDIVTSGAGGADAGTVSNLLLLTACSFVLVMVVWKSSSISKSIVMAS